MVCSTLEKYHSDRIIAGDYHCTAGSDISESSGLSTGARAGIGVAVSVAVLAIAGGLVFYLRRRKRRERVEERSDDIDMVTAELPEVGRDVKVEVPAVEKRGKLPGLKANPVELPGNDSVLWTTLSSPGGQRVVSQDRDIKLTH